jgi:hypothetical protein
MALAEDTMTRLAERQAAERKLVRDMTRRYDRAMTAAEQARTALAGAEAERVAVLGEWLAAPGWTAERIAEVAGVGQRELADAAKASTSGRQLTLGPEAAPAVPRPIKRSPSPTGPARDGQLTAQLTTGAVA